MGLTRREQAVVIRRKIRSQFPLGVPEARLMCAVVEKAIDDGISGGNDAAVMYLSGQIPHAEVCGVDSSWIHRVILEVCDGDAVDCVR
jgi:hypothetical protein